MCAPPTDVALLCMGNVAPVAGQCGVDCKGNSLVESCTAGCIRRMLALSEGCAGCYAAVVACVSRECSEPCATPASLACTECQIEKGCRVRFFDCSGLTGGTPRDAGAALEGGTD
jgi:hypothetical protein